MTDYRADLKHGIDSVGVASFTFNDVIRRGDRKRRNQRVAAGLVGIAVFVAAVWIVRDLASLDRTGTIVPGGSGSTAPAVDRDFRGMYRVRSRDNHLCQEGFGLRRVRVHYVSGTVRTIVPVGWTGPPHWRFTYISGKRYPWSGELADMAAELRYDPATDSAVGVRHGPVHCRWHVRLMPVG